MMRIESSVPITPIHQSCVTGTLVGLTEVYFNHPLWTMKTRMQCGYPFTLHPRILYRGALAEASVMVPVDIMQMIVSTVLNERILLNGDNRSIVKRCAAGFIAGNIGGIFINSIESIMTLQQKYNLNFVKMTNRLIKIIGFRQLFIGSLETSLRNGIYNCGFFAFTPAIDKILRDYCEKNCSILASGLIAGVAVSIISHPCDTIKTYRQVEEKKQTIFQAIQKIYQSHGSKGFFRGLIPRSMRVVSGIAIMGWVYQSLENKR